VLGVRKTNLGKFSDVRILDGLMPGDEVRDVGFIDPDEAAEKAKQDERGQKLLAERKDLEKEGEYDD
jgi:hypothetical protein